MNTWHTKITKTGWRRFRNAAATAVFLLIMCGAVGASWAQIDHLKEMSLDELMDVEVEVASLFSESDLTVGSAVALITEDDWTKFGARRFGEVNDP